MEIRLLLVLTLQQFVIKLCFGQISTDLDRIEEGLMSLEAGAVTLTDKLNKYTELNQDASKKEAAQLQFSLDKTFGSGCSDKEWRCGYSSATCVSRLFVCDGFADCPNGEDEVPDVCDNVLPEGSMWEGFTLFDDCLGGVFETPKMRIDKVPEKQILPGRIRMKFTYINQAVRANDEVFFINPMDGVYEMATRTMWQYPTTGIDCPNLGNAYYSACVFRGGSRTLADCYCWRVYQPPSAPVCCHTVYKRLS